jgi:glyoxylase-like metal-dependent hydrolase (beta-lactamase superfamily II)
MKGLKKFKITISFIVVCMVSVFMAVGAFPGRIIAKLSPPSFPEVSGMKKLADGVFVSTGEYIKVNMGLIVSGEEAAIIDTGLAYEGYTANEALRVKQYLEENNLKLKYIILTHGHIDHIGNLSMFDNPDTTIYSPSDTKDGQVITLGEKLFKAVITKGHFNDEHMSIELVKENILFAGDVVVTNLPSAVAFQGNFEGLVPALKMLRAENYSIIVPGHGDILYPQEAIKMNLEYLGNVEKYVTRIIDDGGTLQDVLKIKLEDCLKNTEYLDPVDSQTVHEMSLETAYYEFLNK